MAPRVQRDWEDGVALGVRATPPFFIGRKVLSGFLAVEQLGRLVDQELVNPALISGEATQPDPSGLSSTPR